VPLCPPQTPHAARTRTRAAAVGSQRLTAELRHGLSRYVNTNYVYAVTFRKSRNVDNIFRTNLC
jgi:hypothetical protein